MTILEAFTCISNYTLQSCIKREYALGYLDVLEEGVRGSTIYVQC